jgi:hypothetical protein
MISPFARAHAGLGHQVDRVRSRFSQRRLLTLAAMGVVCLSLSTRDGQIRFAQAAALLAVALFLSRVARAGNAQTRTALILAWVLGVFITTTRAGRSAGPVTSDLMGSLDANWSQWAHQLGELLTRIAGLIGQLLAGVRDLIGR